MPTAPVDPVAFPDDERAAMRAAYRILAERRRERLAKQSGHVPLPEKHRDAPAETRSNGAVAADRAPV